MNLAVNARDAMTTGGRLTIETADVELDEACAKQLAEVKLGPYALLAVIDSGEGMTPELMGRILNRFSPPKSAERAPGWAWEQCTAS